MSRYPILPALALAACEPSPSYLRPSGYVGDRQAALGWVLLLIAAFVIVVVSALVIAAVYHRRPAASGSMRATGGLRWIVVGGVAIPAAILLATMVYSMVVLAQTARASTAPALTVQVTGHRWWWEVRYPGTESSEVVTGANEIHIPVGVPVKLELSTGDVIHSFWIPQLAGKTDLIPGQRNLAWIEADRPGSYRGQCAEYCGLQHAHMMITVVAQPRGEFTRWLAAQRQPATAPTDGEALVGRDLFVRSACSLCHTVRGTEAGGILGPDLTHVGSRRMIAAGTLSNTPGNLTGWIENPQASKPGVIMPAIPFQPNQLHAVVTYLRALE
ncbi:MAG TPA: cytochrome c oxidase subunit II [Gemmatimonadales bacterium]|jgi:cytochrome c oxidase subunit 2